MISAFGVVHKKLTPNDVAVKLAAKSGDNVSARFARLQEAKRISNQYGKKPIFKSDEISAFGVVHKGALKGAVMGSGGIRNALIHPVRTASVAAQTNIVNAAGSVKNARLRRAMKHHIREPGHVGHKLHTGETVLQGFKSAKGGAAAAPDIASSVMGDIPSSLSGAAQSLFRLKGYPVG